jgi:hypothetical protein
VLRGTVFTSHKVPEAVEPGVSAPSVEGPPRPASVQTRASNVLRPRSAPPAAPAAPPPPPPAAQSGPLSGPVSGVASGRTAAVSGVQPAVGTSQRGASAEGRGIFVSVEMAVLGIILLALGLVSSYYMGYNVGKDEKSLRGGTSAPANDKEKANGEGTGPGMKKVDPKSLGRTRVGDRPGPGRKTTVPPPPKGTGKWTVEIVRFGSREKNIAEYRARQLKGRGLRDVWVTKRKMGRGYEWSVCSGRFASTQSAEKARRDIVALGRVPARLVNVFKYE